MRSAEPHLAAPPIIVSPSRATRGPRRTRKAFRPVFLDALAGLVTLLPIVAAFAAPGTPWTSALLVAGLGVVALLTLLTWQGLYRGDIIRTFPSGLEAFTRTAKCVPWVVLTVAAALSFTGSTDTRRVLAVAVAAAVPLMATVPAMRGIANVLRRRLATNSSQRVLIVGCGDVASRVADRLERTGDLVVVGMVDDDPSPGFKSIGGVDDIEALCESHDVDRIVVASPSGSWSVVSETLSPLIPRLHVSIVAPMHELMTWRSGLAEVSGLPVIPLVGRQRAALASLAKRVLDILGALAGLIVFAPVLLLAALAVKLTTPGPAIFRQRRAGLHDEEFTILKFRTMRVNAEEFRAELMHSNEADGPRFKMSKDPRVTRVGAFLRRFSIDELPQLFNVLAGSMSLVGPRPFPLVESGAFHVGVAEARFDMKPGMTGLWQVSGRSDLSWEDLCHLDAIYVRSWSLLWDLRILLQTPVVALRRQGAY
jgi:exopolysaccharide biosynthesis polyprenyl glycosylphosphotransferase